MPPPHIQTITPWHRRQVKRIKLTTCSEGEFTCNDGQCITMEQREVWAFKSINQSIDKGVTKHQTVLTNQMRTTASSYSWRWAKSSQVPQLTLSTKVEVGEPDMANLNISLILLQNQENYNKKIAPFSFDKINNVNIPVNINVSISVVDIIKIEEVDHVYILKFRLVLEWYLFMKLMMTNLYTKGMTIESNISTWRGQDHRMPWLLRMCTSFGFPFWFLTIPREMKQQRWIIDATIVFEILNIEIDPFRAHGTPNWHWRGRATSLEAQRTLSRHSIQFKTNSTKLAW